MRRVLITGIDGSLGSVLELEFRKAGYDVFGIRKAEIYLPSTIDGVISHLPTMDFVVNNHGTNKLAWIGQDIIEREIYDILNINVNCMYAVVDSLKRHQDEPATVLNIASVTYRIAQRTTALYCASKAAVVQLTKVMARELAPRGWVVNCLAPGKMVDTEMAEKTDEQVRHLRGWNQENAEEYALGMIPMGRHTNTIEVAEAVIKIMDLPDYINGACIDMTGGV